MNGLVIVDKPEGLTSAEVVRRAKRLLHAKTGHLGTLDPFASGVLPLCVGDGTKIAQFLNEADKTYTGLIRLGAETDTGDLSGAITRTAPVPALDQSRLEQVAERFTGEIEQIPPMYSAIKQGGKPLYKLARQGIEVARDPRSVRISAFELKLQDPNTLAFAVSCSKGTYVRVLAADVALALGTAGHLIALRRTRFGGFTENDAVALETLGAATPVIGLSDALREIRHYTLSASEVVRARSGFVPLLESVPSGGPGEMLKLVDDAGALIAVIEWRQGSWRYVRVFS